MDLEAFDHFLTARDLALTTGYRQRLPLAVPQAGHEQLLDSMRRMLGHDIPVRIFSGRSDPDADEPGADEPDAEGPAAGQPIDIDPGFFHAPRMTSRPGVAADRGWAVNLPLRIPGGIDRGKVFDDGFYRIRQGIDRDRIIDDGIARVVPGSDPFHPNPGSIIKAEPLLLRDHPDAARSVIQLLDSRINATPSSTRWADSATVPERAPAPARLTAQPVRPFSDAVSNFRSPAPGPSTATHPPGAGVFAPQASAPRVSPPARSTPAASAESDRASSDRGTISVQPTATLVERLAAAVADRAASLAESVAETSVDHLRQEIFASQAARNSLLPH